MILGIVPARLESSRLPGKPLARIGEYTMIQRVYLQAKKCQSLTDVIVATDHQDILEDIRKIGGNSILTSSDHRNGTSRCMEVAEQFPADFYINIQGDEPFISPSQIDLICESLVAGAEIATLRKRIVDEDQLFDENVVKVVCDEQEIALYFSRQAIPFVKGIARKQWLEKHTFFKHIGIYGFSKDAIQAIRKITTSPLEMAESLEQLAWLQAGLRISTRETTQESLSIDTQEDLDRAIKLHNEGS